MKIRLASQVATDDLSKEVVVVLDALGDVNPDLRERIRDALVTDESTVNDFLPMGEVDHYVRKNPDEAWTPKWADPELKKKNDEALARMSEKLGVSVERASRIVQIARAIRVKGRS